MKTGTFLGGMLGAVILISNAALSAELTWDSDPATGGVQDGAGTWDALATNWWNGSANTNWSSATPDRAVFGASNGEAGVISVLETQTVGGIEFQPPGSGAYTVSGGELALAGTVTVAAHADAAIGSVLSGGSIVKSGVGTLTLTGANTYTGATTLSAGTITATAINRLSTNGQDLILGDAGTAGADLRLRMNGNFDLGTVTVTADATGSNTLEIVSGGKVNHQAIAVGRPLTLALSAAVLSDTQCTSANKLLTGGTGAGTEALLISTFAGGTIRSSIAGGTATNASSFTGNVRVTGGGVWQMQNVTYFNNNASNQNLWIPDASSVTVDPGASWYVTWGDETVDGLNGGGLVLCHGSTQPHTLTLGGGGGGGVFAGTLTGGNTSIAKIGGGTQTLAGAGINYTGGTSLRGGTLVLSNTTGFASAAVSLANGATLRFDGGSSYAFARAISGTGSVVKAGDSTVTLSAAGTYHGATAVEGGTLRLGGQNFLPADTALEVSQGAALDLGTNSQSVASLALGRNGSDSAVLKSTANGAQMPVVTVTDTDGLSLNGTTTFEVSGTVPPLGSTNTLIAYAGTSIGSGELLVALSNPRSLAIVTNNAAAGRVELIVTAFDSLRWVGSPTNGWQVGGAENWALAASGIPAAFSNGDSVIFDDSASNSLVSVNGAVFPGSVQVDAAGGYVFEGGPVIAAGDLQAAGTGTTTIHNIQFGLNLRVTNGTVVVGDGGTNGLVVAAGGIFDDGAIVLNRSDSFTVSNAISGAGALVKRGEGTVALSASNTFGGTYTISRGKLTATSKDAVNGRNSVFLGDEDTGTNAVTLSFTIGNNSTAVSNITVVAGPTGPARINGANDATPQSVVCRIILERAVTLGLDGGGLGDLEPLITGAGAGAGNDTLLIEPGAGLTLRTSQRNFGSNTFAGNVRIVSGRWQMQNASFLGNDLAHQNLVIPDVSSITMETGTTWSITHGVETVDGLNGAGTVGGVGGTAYLLGAPTLTVGAGGGGGVFSGRLQNDGIAFSLAKVGTGTQTLSGVSTYTGGTTLSGGALAIGNSAALGWGSLTMAGGTLMAAGSPVTVTSTLNMAAASFVDTSTGDLTLSGTITNAGALTKQGPGTLTLSGINTNAPLLVVSNGTLDITGSVGGPLVAAGGTLRVSGTTGTGLVTVASGGTVDGTGTIGGPIDCSGTLSPGVSPGQLTVSGAITMNAGARLRVELGGLTQGSEYDLLKADGSISLGGDIEVSFVDGFEASVAPGDLFYVVQAGSLDGEFANAPIEGTIAVGGQTFAVHYGPDSTYGSTNVVLEAVAASADSDGDGLTDDEETALGTDAFDPDSDDDGMNDGDEVVSGSNPRDADSIGYRISHERKVGGGISILWSSASNRNYDVLSSTNLPGAQIWTPVATVPSGGATTGYTNAAPGEAESYQIKARR
jgi:fibronectin-binding autotransporter adhesin